jgi:hypothetical protein
VLVVVGGEECCDRNPFHASAQGSGPYPPIEVAPS